MEIVANVIDVDEDDDRKLPAVDNLDINNYHGKDSHNDHGNDIDQDVIRIKRLSYF